MNTTKEFIISFAVCFLLGLLLFVNYSASVMPPQVVASRSDNGAGNSWREQRVQQNIQIATEAQQITSNHGGIEAAKSQAGAEYAVEYDQIIEKLKADDSPKKRGANPTPPRGKPHDPKNSIPANPTPPGKHPSGGHSGPPPN